VKTPVYFFSLADVLGFVSAFVSVLFSAADASVFAAWPLPEGDEPDLCA
jgi:hypothetical protein